MPTFYFGVIDLLYHQIFSFPVVRVLETRMEIRMTTKTIMTTKTTKPFLHVAWANLWSKKEEKQRSLFDHRVLFSQMPFSVRNLLQVLLNLSIYAEAFKFILSKSKQQISLILGLKFIFYLSRVYCSLYSVS